MKGESPDYAKTLGILGNKSQDELQSLTNKWNGVMILHVPVTISSLISMVGDSGVSLENHQPLVTQFTKIPHTRIYPSGL